MEPPQPTSTMILRAARQVLVRDGADHVTVAAVAREAGLSVGGLRYHYASKRDLLAALVDAFVVGFDAAMASAGPEPGARTRAYLVGTLGSETTERSADKDSSAIGLFAAAAVDTSLLAELRTKFEQWQELIVDDGIDPAVSTTVRLAMDGWWLAATLDLAPPTAELARATRRHLTRLVDDAVKSLD